MVVVKVSLAAAQAEPALLLAKKRKKYAVVGVSPLICLVKPADFGPSTMLLLHAPAVMPPSVRP